MGFFRKLFLGASEPMDTGNEISAEDHWQRVANLSFPELTTYWEGLAGNEVTMEEFLAVRARAYELALRAPGVAGPERHLALAFAGSIATFAGKPPYRSVNIEHQDAFKDFINVLKNTGDIDRD
jgi:hypothetical protein